MKNYRYEKARKMVKARKEFYEHLTAYVVMSLFFFLLNAVTAFGAWWFYWPILGWGIGVLFHYFDVFGLPGVGTMSKDWEEKAIREEMEKMEHMERRYGSYKYKKEEEEDKPDDHLELREIEKEKIVRRNSWSEDDLV